MKNILVMCLILLGILLLNTGCQSMFPVEQTRTLNRWTNYDETQVTFGKIIPNQTTVEELKALGLDPHSSPNIKVLTYLDVITRFIPNQSITKDDLPPDIKKCIESRDCCQAYELNIDVNRSKRQGNLLLDVFSFKRTARITGWNFKGLIVIQDGIVTYKLISGEPSVNRLDKKIRPLGPFQELDGMAAKLPGML